VSKPTPIMEVVANPDGSFTYNLVPTMFDTHAYAIFLSTLTDLVGKMMAQEGGLDAERVKLEIAGHYADEITHPSPRDEQQLHLLQ